MTAPTKSSNYVLSFILVLLTTIVLISGTKYYLAESKTTEKLSTPSPNLSWPDSVTYETYNNATQGYSLRYLNVVKPFPINTESVIFAISATDHWVYEISSKSLTNSISLDTAVNNYFGTIERNRSEFTVTQTTIGGQPAIYFIDPNATDYGNSGIITIYNNKIYTILGDTNSQFDGGSEFVNFYSSFTFI